MNWHDYIPALRVALLAAATPLPWMWIDDTHEGVLGPERKGDEMNWHDYIIRRDGGKLDCVASLADVPVCETCYGNAMVADTRGPGRRLDVPCPDCAGTGYGWHWRVTPTAGMLVQSTGRGKHLTVRDETGEWRVLEDHCPLVDGGDNYADPWFTPLLPPASVAPPLELLALIGMPCDDACLINHDCGPTADVYSLIGRPTHFRCADYTGDTAPLRLALQHHDALTQWLAQAALRGEVKE